MFLILEDDHKKHLSYISQFQPEVIKEFCLLATQFLQNGINPKLYNVAANKLEVDIDLIKQSIESLMYLLIQASKLMLSKEAFKDSLVGLQLLDCITEELTDWYGNHYFELRNSRSPFDIISYKNLQWRIEMQIASKLLNHHLKPTITLKLDLENPSATYEKCVILQVDPSNLVHMTQVLEQSLTNIQSQHSRRMIRNIK